MTLEVRTAGIIPTEYPPPFPVYSLRLWGEGTTHYRLSLEPKGGKWAAVIPVGATGEMSYGETPILDG